MPNNPIQSERRSFLTRLNAGVASLGAIALGGVAVAQVKSAPASKFEPARHPQDDWMDQIPGKHRMVVDTTNFDKFGDAMLFANNFIAANGTGYNLGASDLAVIVIARHQSTSLAFNDEMWAKYGAQFVGDAPEAMKANPPKKNPNGMIEGVAKQGVQFAVCAMATRRIAGIVARATSGNVDTVFAELTSHLIANAHMAPAGIVAVTRAQERGYSLVTA